MATFDPAIEVQLDGPTVRRATLAIFEFASGPTRLWEGFRDLVIDGETFRGLGNLGRINAVNSGPGQAVEEIVFQLTGNSDMLAFFDEDSDETVGREVTLFFQFFNADWSAISETVQYFWGRMGAPFVDRELHGVGDPASRIVSVRATNPFINRRRPPFAFYSDRDQKARTDGTDNLFIRASQMASAKVAWPSF